MASSIHIPATALNDVAFALLEQYVQGKISDMITLAKIDVELAIQLEQTKTIPVLEDVAAWQLVLGWAASDELSFDDFLVQMKKKFKDRFKFDEWSSVFDEVFKASHEGAAIAIEVVKAAMIKHGILYHPIIIDNLQPVSLMPPFPMVPLSQRLITRGHGLEVTISTSDQGHPIAYCEGKEYYYGCSHIYFPMKWVKALNGGKMETLERSSDEVVEALEISVHDFKLEFPTGTSIQVIVGLNCGFQGIVIGKVDDMYILQGSDQQASHGLGNMLHWYSSHKILITPSTLQQADPDNLGDKGKSKAQEPKVPGGDGNINEGSDLIQVSVSMDEALIVPSSTLQFSRERGHQGLIHSVDFISGHLTVLSNDGPLHDVLIGFCIKLENHSLCDIECQVGCELKNTAVVTDATPPMSTVDPSAKLGPSTLACDPWVSHPDDITPWPLNKLVQANVDYGCVPWLFNNNFCDYANWHLSTSWSCVSHWDLQYTCDLTPTNPRSAGQIHWVKKCQVKKDLKGVELEDSTKLPLGDICQVISAN
ncbi:hypothetical protein EDC04DRAFT_2600328 [Pisolithus marmoratus]|nr:hypothetical protein EDC04DRAFT_2600328 [Pisolithus marmoratus]